MDAAAITGYHASPKGLRHGFGVQAVSAVGERSYAAPGPVTTTTAAEFLRRSALDLDP